MKQTRLGKTKSAISILLLFNEKKELQMQKNGVPVKESL